MAAKRVLATARQLVAQGFQHPVHMTLGAGAALDGEAHGLVEHQHVLVLVERDRLEEGARILVMGGDARSRLRLVEFQGRHAHLGARLQPLVRLGALAVDAQLAFPHDALDMGEGELRKPRHEKAVDAHAGLVRRDDERLHAGGKDLLRRGLGLGLRRRAGTCGHIGRLDVLRAQLARIGAPALPRRTAPTPRIVLAASGTALFHGPGGNIAVACRTGP
jgi:hypothetical protein